ncbi:alpha/beta hydrolase [Leptodesmis sp.]|uniref:alpha/beta hydrolase n=1 Tax=Leptodesmis sp. TaxID=3100501 RepID=UPI0040534EA2
MQSVGIQHREEWLEGFQGLKLFCQSWHSGVLPCAVLLLVPGLGGHSGLFSNLVQHFLPLGYNLYAYDLRGNGRSQGRRGHIHRWAEFREDLRRFLHWVQDQEPGYPCFLLGHSLGSVITLDYGLHYPAEAQRLQGVIAIAPALGQVGVSSIKIALGRLLSRIWPQFSLPTSWDRSTASRDSAFVAAATQDPLRHSWVSARLSTEYFATVDWIQAHAADWSLPLLILQGEGDRVVSPESSRTFFQHVTLPDKEWQSYPEGYHELHNDLCAAALFANLESWLTRHLPS